MNSISDGDSIAAIIIIGTIASRLFFAYSWLASSKNTIDARNTSTTKTHEAKHHDGDIISTTRKFSTPKIQELTLILKEVEIVEVVEIFPITSG